MKMITPGTGSPLPYADRAGPAARAAGGIVLAHGLWEHEL